jgi:2-keto-myo-inositol isomerase
MKLCLSQACTLPNGFAEDLIGYSEGGVHHVEVWLTKLEQYLEKHTPEELLALIQERDITFAAAAYQGGLLLSQGDQRQIHFDHFRKRLELCQTFKIPTLLLVADFAQRPDNTSIQRAMVSLKQASQWAAGYGVRLGLEFRGSDSFCSSLDTAISMVEGIDEPNVGVCLDFFHFYKGPSKTEDLQRLTKANLAHVQLCDVPGVPREVMSDSDRVFPGEGDFQTQPLIQQLRSINYEGYLSVEVFNPILWQSKPTQVAELAKASVERLL